METQRKIVYKGEMKGISFYGSQAGDLHFPPWSVYSDGHCLKEKEKKKNLPWKSGFSFQPVHTESFEEDF